MIAFFAPLATSILCIKGLYIFGKEATPLVVVESDRHNIWMASCSLIVSIGFTALGYAASVLYTGLHSSTLQRVLLVFVVLGLFVISAGILALYTPWTRHGLREIRSYGQQIRESCAQRRQDRLPRINLEP
jgi:H+/Cl- antiporter ClcA